MTFPFTFTQIVTFLGLLGVPSIGTMTLWCVKSCKKYTQDLRILQNAQKAQMRSQLLKQYYFYKEQGWIYSDDLDDWMNQYNAYHQLEGENGVLDSRKAELIKLPSKNSPIN